MPPGFDGTSVTVLKGIATRVAERLQRLGIETVQDLLFHLPARYEDRTRLRPLGSLQAGNEAMVQGTIELTEVRFGRRRMLLSRIFDGTGFLTLRFFHFSAAQQRSLAKDSIIRCYGELRRSGSDLEMVHPEYRIIDPDAAQTIEQTLTPVYPTTEGVHQLSFRRFTEQATGLLAQQSERLPELLDTPLCKKMNLPLLADSLQYIHHPPKSANTQQLQQGIHPMQRRLALEELLSHHLSIRQLRSQVKDSHSLQINQAKELTTDFIGNLPFSLTGAQQRVIGEIFCDLGQKTAMQRLLQGDVGSGKTIIAALAALAAIRGGYQAALMAPTELLAEQHLQTLSQWLAPLGIKLSLLTGKLPASKKRRILAAMETGDCDLVIGTHALFQDDCTFARLGLIIVDEQHRFGVHQRLALREKGRHGKFVPHQLIMTATPIPRTLAMTAYADLDTSIIDELPPGRQPVETAVMPDTRRAEIISGVKNACGQGRQVYWVCTLIEESEALQCQAAEVTAELLTETLEGLRISLIHGRMKAAEKELVMEDFRNGKTDILVATTVIEVGVDVPNASLMVIENAERLGLAQLHQLRGRVGRGSAASACVLMYQGKLSANGRARLAAMRETSDGFEIARIDLELRGPGELLGTRQTGLLQFRIADLSRDADLLEQVPELAAEIEDKAPERVPLLIRRWAGDVMGYGDV
ncbi:MAG: ATP-dependent DNA helicase RecG [Arenicellales bacterium]